MTGILLKSLTALVLLGSPDDELLRRAVELRAQGELAGAARLLVTPDGGSACGPALSGWCELLRGDALFYMGRYREAAEALERAVRHEPSGAAAKRARARLAEAHDRADQLPLAIAQYRTAVRDSPSSDLQLAFGDALERAGKRAEALEQWRSAWLNDVTLPSSRTAGERLRAAGAKTRPAELTTRAGRLLARGAPAVALAELEETPVEADADDLARLALLRGRALQSLGRDAEAEETWKSVLGGKARAELKAEAALALGRAALNRGAEEGAAALGKVAADFPTTSSGEEAAFLAAWARFNSGDHRRCIEAFDAFLEARQGAPRRDEALWYSGLCRLLAGDRDGAHPRFETLSKSKRFAEQAAYWAAHTAPAKETEPRLRALIDRHPMSWYAWLARSRLKALGRELGALPFSAAGATARLADEELPARARALARAGLLREAAEELELEGARERNPERAEKLARAADALGLHRVSYSIANSRLWSRAIAQRVPSALALLYPRAHAAELTKAAGAVGLDPFFAWAIMRRESRFDPSARSFASAYGLMQLLVPTARKIALLSGEPEPGETELYDPRRTLPLASWYLAELAGRFGHLALAAAAYNGGPEPVSQWVKARHDVPLDLFVELIPFRETRGYVKGVLGDYYTYRSLHGAEPRYPDLALQPPKEGVAF